MLEMPADEHSESQSVSKYGGNKTPLPADKITGTRIRDRRIAVGVSQQALANRIGVTFQQVQKYEKGVNRVCAGRLHAIAQILGTTPGFFFASNNETSNAETAELPAQPLKNLIFGSNVRAKRKALGVNQEALAAKIGVSARVIQRFEQGRSNLRPPLLLAIARALDMSRELSSTDGGPITSDDATRYAGSAEGIQLNLAVAGISDPAIRWRVIEFAEELRRKQFPFEAAQ